MSFKDIIPIILGLIGIGLKAVNLIDFKEFLMILIIAKLVEITFVLEDSNNYKKEVQHE